MVLVSNRLVFNYLEDSKVKQIFTLLEEDVEVQSYLRMSNIMAVKRLGYNDHGPVHARIISGSALRIFNLITTAVEPSLLLHGVGDMEDAKLVTMTIAYLHDIGNAVHRNEHEKMGVFLAAPILDRLLTEVYPRDEHHVYNLKSEILHGIYASDDDIQCFSVEAGIATIADGTDMAEGRTRIPFKRGKVDIHSLSALAIRRVEIKKGEDKPVLIEVYMDNPAGVFQIEEVMGKKMATSGLEDLVEVTAIMNGKTLKTL
jgi:metal-dependent HD superfamily phosphatase/phosphodiesterase